MNVLSLLEKIDLSSIGCSFADIRIEERTFTSITIENHIVSNGIEESNVSAFIRIYSGGRWFYTSASDLSLIQEKILSLAKTAKSFKGVEKRFFQLSKPHKSILLKKENKNSTVYSIKEKLELLKHFDSLTANLNLCKISQTNYIDRYSKVYYANSAGVKSAYDYTGAQIGLFYTLSGGGEPFADNCKIYSSDFSGLNSSEDLLKSSIDESIDFLNAKNADPGVYPLILSPMTTGVFAHESFGHKSEADFMLGDENMKKEWEIGKKVGSKVLSIIDDGNIEDASGYCPIDDEGTRANKTYLIKNGLLSGRLHSLQTAEELLEEPTGNARALNAEYEPIVRMTNTYIDKGDKTFSDLVSSVKDGFYIKTLKHGSGLSTFTIAPLRSYRIKNGKIVEPVKINVITGTVFETLGDIEALSDTVVLHSSLLGGCGKMEQYPLRVSFGGPDMLVSKMNVS